MQTEKIIALQASMNDEIVGLTLLESFEYINPETILRIMDSDKAAPVDAALDAIEHDPSRTIPDPFELTYTEGADLEALEELLDSIVVTLYTKEGMGKASFADIFFAIETKDKQRAHEILNAIYHAPNIRLQTTIKHFFPTFVPTPS